MPPSAKRKYDYYEACTSPTMPPAAAGPSTTYDSCYEFEPIIPTPELQELYNKWQQQKAMHDHLQYEAEPAHGDGNNLNDGQNDLLRPPSPTATATTMSRSPSCASTSRSVTRGLNGMGLGEDKALGKKRKQGRQGPLEAPDKARTAFVRKLKACENCRKRKVKCDHYNFRLFEEAYQASAAMTTGPPAPQVTVTNPDIQTQLHDLIGVGVNLNNISPQPPFQTSQEDAHMDFENLLRQAQPASASPNTSPLYNFSQPWQNSSNVNAGPSTSSYPVLSPNPFTAPRTEPADCHVPIGRLITQDDAEWDEAEEWECRFGDDGTASSHSNASDEMAICKQRYESLSNLEEHYQIEHVPFENGKVYPRCKRCELHYDNEWWSNCPVCNVPREDPEQWYFGDILSTSSRMSGQSIRVAGKDWQPPSLTRNQTITQFNMTGYGATLGTQANSNMPYYSYQTANGYGNASCNSQSERGRNTKTAALSSKPKLPPSVTQKAEINSGMCLSGGTSSGGGKSCPLYAMRKELMPNTSKRYSQPVSLRLVAPSGLRSFRSAHPAFLRLLLLFLITFVLTHGWLASTATATGRGRGRGIQRVVPWKKSSWSSGVTAAHVAEISIGCVLVGLVGMWLVKHARFRLWAANEDERRSRRQFYHRQQRCLMRDVVGIPQRHDLEGVAEFHPVLAVNSSHRADQRGFYTRASAAAAG